MKRTAILVAIVLGGLGLAVAAQQPAAGQGGQGAGRGPQGPNVAEIQKVKDNLYMLTGGGGNTAALIRADGVTLVDTKLANWGPAIMEKLRTVTDKPVTTIINTHTHGDHVCSNEFFDARVEIVTHENTRANMEKMEALKGKANAIPDRTFKDRLTIGRGAEQIDLYYFGAGHTNGDALVVFPALRLLHMGDLFPGKQAPFVDATNGGSGVAYPDTLAKATQTIRNVDAVIPGHSTVMTWADLIEFTEFNREFLAGARAARQAGRTPEQAAAELKLPAKFSGYTMARAPANMTVIFNELSR
jgi:glyoxylase-like metal-dependent hydrolase (beta-lactamase superfamily II)